MGGSSSKLARRRSSSGSAAPPSPAKKKRDSKKALATPTKDLLRMLSTDPAAARRASRDVRAARFAADFDRDFDADEPAAGGPSRGLFVRLEEKLAACGADIERIPGE